MAKSKPAEGILAGTRVLELTTTVAGPFCGRLLADFGAEVIKVEPLGGDDVRLLGKRFRGKSLYAASIFRNKSLIAVDLKTAEGQRIVRRIAAKCQIVIENFRPGTLERWNLGYRTLAADNPRLVMVSVSGYGQSGPYRERPGYGVILEAVSGLRHITGDADRPATRVGTPLTDYITGLYAAFGAMMALRHAERTGEGQLVDAALYEGAFSFMEPFVPAFEKLGLVPERAGSRLPDATPNNQYPTADGQTILIAASGQSVFQRLAAAMGREELPADERFADGVVRSRHEDELDAIIAEWTGARPLAELETTLQQAGVPVTRVFTMADIFADPHYRAREMLVEVPDDELGTVTQAAPVPRLSATPGRLRWSGRRVGQDTARILAELGGCSPDETARLEAAGVIDCGRGIVAGEAAQSAATEPAGEPPG